VGEDGEIGCGIGQASRERGIYETCGYAVKITFKELQPFLNEKGKAVAALFRKSGAKKKQ
jgi:hypothetical protein